MQPLLARDALFKMIYSDIANNPALCALNIIAKRKVDLDAKINSGFFGCEENSLSTIAEGLDNHSAVIDYLKSMVLEDEDVDF